MQQQCGRLEAGGGPGGRNTGSAPSRIGADRFDAGRDDRGFSLGSYLLLVDYTARLFRRGKATLSPEMAEILDRLHTSAEQWQARLDRLRTGRPLGRFFAATRARLREIGTRLNLKHVPNLGGCPVT